jgi:hypothetical protein
MNNAAALVGITLDRTPAAFAELQADNSKN